MNVLPKLLYIFQSIPIFIPKSFFVTLALFLNSYGMVRLQRFEKVFLQKPRHLGGLALPNFLFYYWAANMRSMLHWNNSNNLDSPPAWLNIENASCKSSSLNAFLCFSITLSPLKYSDNIIVKNSLKIWIQFLRNFGLQAIPRYISICCFFLLPWMVPMLTGGIKVFTL